jgi:acid stress-induced BolA-like protein IbaG/YrbA
MITPEEIKDTVSKAFPVSIIQTQDLTGGGDHWQLIIVSPAFEGRGLLEQQRMVHDALREAMRTERIHALTMRLYTPGQWDKLGS